MPEASITAVTVDAGNNLLYCDPSSAEVYSDHLGDRPREPILLDA